MEIKEEHLQRVFDEIEERSISNGKNGAEYDIIVSTAWSMRTKLLAILRSKSEEDLVFSKIVAKDFVKMLEENNGDICYIRYKCGHGVRPEKIITLTGSLDNYSEWKNDLDGFCIECWLMKKRRQDNKG